MRARPKTHGMSTAMRRTLERSSVGGDDAGADRARYGQRQEKFPGALIQVQDSDYRLREGEVSCWVEVDGISVYIHRGEDERSGVSRVYVDAYAKGDEDGRELASFSVKTR